MLHRTNWYGTQFRCHFFVRLGVMMFMACSILCCSRCLGSSRTCWRTVNPVNWSCVRLAIGVAPPGTWMCGSTALAACSSSAAGSVSPGRTACSNCMFYSAVTTAAMLSQSRCSTWACAACNTTRPTVRALYNQNVNSTVCYRKFSCIFLYDEQRDLLRWSCQTLSSTGP